MLDSILHTLHNPKAGLMNNGVRKRTQYARTNCSEVVGKDKLSFGGTKNLKSVLSKVLKNGKNLGENILIFMTAVPILLCLYPLVKSIEYLEKEANAGREEKSKKISEQEKNIPEK